MPLIEVRNLQKIYGDDGLSTPVLHNLTFSVENGEFLSIMGPSGSGKSTLLHILGFLDHQTGGDYFFEGKSITDYSKKDLAHVRNKKMGFVFQMFNLLPKTTVLDNVKLPLMYSDIPKQRWDELALQAIDSVGLSHRLDHWASQLSGGEQQRVAIARALVNEPQVIFADEPTGNLDSKSSQGIMAVFEKLHSGRKHTIILITHETYIAEYSRRIIRLYDGAIELDVAVADPRKSADFTK